MALSLLCFLIVKPTASISRFKVAIACLYTSDEDLEPDLASFASTLRATCTSCCLVSLHADQLSVGQALRHSNLLASSWHQPAPQVQPHCLQMTGKNTIPSR